MGICTREFGGNVGHPTPAKEGFKAGIGIDGGAPYG
jgi:hypothetical protein